MPQALEIDSPLQGHTRSAYEFKEMPPQTQCALNKHTLRVCAPPSPGNPPYCLPNPPPLMYISAVSRPPNAVLEELVIEPRTTSPAFATSMLRKIPGAL
jgi:hypothetical protein